MTTRSRNILRAGIAAAVGVALAVAGAEAWLRLRPPVSLLRATPEVTIGRGSGLHPSRGAFQIDPELGFRPVLGGALYDERGVLPNDYALDKPAGVRRVLFLGDSVTQRGKIVDAVREIHGEEGYEFWNAGVEAWSTGQQVAWFRDVLGPIEPDVVVLIFHLNDFESTPIVFIDRDERMVAVHARVARRDFVPWLLRHSYLYRYWIHLRIGGWAPGDDIHPSVVREVESSLLELRDLCTERGAALRVLVFPAMLPVGDWPPELRRRRETALGMLEVLGIPHWDLVAALEETLAAGLDPRERPGDFQHPSAAFATIAAQRVWEQGLLSP